MKINKSSDLLLNVFFPLLLGYFIYFFSDIMSMPLPVKNYFPDGLWAYSFISAILILWRREFNSLWITIAFLLAACFELMQYVHWLQGTGDMFDILIYVTFFGIALSANKFFKNPGSIKST